ncbi:hypothetical protein T03_17781 [Trichinella britovi]|uniref:Uncharacterized protein n=1 Tax=Trichinella britovi TaxID=45882 RepID=A0A0V1CF56_TRIBR|nr:hypothetical protein T03_17781 [Trichinella britovi]
MKTDKYKIAISAILDLFHVGYSNLKHCCNFVISMTAIQLLWTETILSMIDFSWYGRCSKTSKLENFSPALLNIRQNEVLQPKKAR